MSKPQFVLKPFDISPSYFDLVRQEAYEVQGHFAEAFGEGALRGMVTALTLLMGVTFAIMTHGISTTASTSGTEGMLPLMLVIAAFGVAGGLACVGVAAYRQRRRSPDERLTVMAAYFQCMAAATFNIRLAKLMRDIEEGTQSKPDLLAEARELRLDGPRIADRLRRLEIYLVSETTGLETPPLQLITL